MIKTELEVIPSDGILYFSATWCQPCKQMKPIVESIDRDVFYVDIEQNESLVLQEFGIRSVPTFIKLVDGKEL